MLLNTAEIYAKPLTNVGFTPVFSYIPDIPGATRQSQASFALSPLLGYNHADGALAEKLGTGLQNLKDESVTRTRLQY